MRSGIDGCINTRVRGHVQACIVNYFTGWRMNSTDGGYEMKEKTDDEIEEDLDAMQKKLEQMKKELEEC